jgi:hypothetical protein
MTEPDTIIADRHDYANCGNSFGMEGRATVTTRLV